MTGGADRDDARLKVAAVLPHRAADLERMQALAIGGAPTVTVVGKYNHGKSRLLNELIGHDRFVVADKRETVELSGLLKDGVYWLDAPGLDADVGTKDDRQALRAAWLAADIRLFVHAAKEGELDEKELALIDEFHADERRTRRQTLLVLTQIDQLGSTGELDGICHAIAAQAGARAGRLINVSSTRHRKGVEERKELLRTRSGIPELHATLVEALARVPQARAHETALLSGDIRDDLRALRARQAASYEALERMQAQQRQSFDEGLKAVVDKAGDAICAMLDALATDYSLVPDTAKDAYASTAGKRERAHVQMAYSRACMEIQSFLAGHDALELPAEQQTIARGMNSAMIAVLGVSVKFRRDLLRMFGDEAGRSRIRDGFTHYYELSRDRRALVGRISQAEAAMLATDRAEAAFIVLDPGT